jgi:predicted RNase H-like nuclease (RuvC/YqgF family)
LSKKNGGQSLQELDLEKRLEQILGVKQELFLENQSLKEKIHSLDEDSIKLASRTEELRLQLYSQTLNYKQEVQNLAVQEHSLQQNLQEVLQEKLRLQLEEKNLTEENRVQRQESENFAEKIRDYQAQMESLGQHNSKLLRNVSDLRKEARGLSRENKEFGQQLAAFRRLNGKLDLELNNSYQEVFDLQKKLRTIMLQNQALENEVQELAILNNSLFEKNRFLEQEGRRYSRENQILRDTIQFPMRELQDTKATRLAVPEADENEEGDECEINKHVIVRPSWVGTEAINILPRRERTSLKCQRRIGQRGAERSCGHAQANGAAGA